MMQSFYLVCLSSLLAAPAYAFDVGTMVGNIVTSNVNQQSAAAAQKQAAVANPTSQPPAAPLPDNRVYYGCADCGTGYYVPGPVIYSSQAYGTGIYARPASASPAPAPLPEGPKLTDSGTTIPEPPPKAPEAAEATPKPVATTCYDYGCKSEAPKPAVAQAPPASQEIPVGPVNLLVSGNPAPVYGVSHGNSVVIGETEVPNWMLHAAGVQVGSGSSRSRSAE
jgi:hypothetical protein